MTLGQVQAPVFHSIRQQIHHMTSDLYKLVRDIESCEAVRDLDIMMPALTTLRSDLIRLKDGLDRLHRMTHDQMLGEQGRGATASVITGLTLGFMIGKYWGSSSPSPLLPVLTDLALRLGMPRQQII
jgi:hypothetical protein